MELMFLIVADIRCVWSSGSGEEDIKRTDFCVALHVRGKEALLTSVHFCVFYNHHLFLLTKRKSYHLYYAAGCGTAWRLLTKRRKCNFLLIALRININSRPAELEDRQITVSLLGAFVRKQRYSDCGVL